MRSLPKRQVKQLSISESMFAHTVILTVTTLLTPFRSTLAKSTALPQSLRMARGTSRSLQTRRPPSASYLLMISASTRSTTSARWLCPLVAHHIVVQNTRIHLAGRLACPTVPVHSVQSRHCLSTTQWARTSMLRTKLTLAYHTPTPRFLQQLLPCKTYHQHGRRLQPVGRRQRTTPLHRILRWSMAHFSIKIRPILEPKCLQFGRKSRLISPDSLPWQHICQRLPASMAKRGVCPYPSRVASPTIGVPVK